MEHESTGRPPQTPASRPRHQRDDRRTRFHGRADSQPRVVERADANANAQEHAGTAGAGQKVGQTNQICLTASAEHAREAPRVPVAHIKNIQAHICMRCTLQRTKVSEVSQQAT